jgi:hypothetical protein
VHSRLVGSLHCIIDFCVVKNDKGIVAAELKRSFFHVFATEFCQHFARGSMAYELEASRETTLNQTPDLVFVDKHMLEFPLVESGLVEKSLQREGAVRRR